MKKISIWIAALSLVLAVSCKEDEPVIPSVAGTTWDVYVKWTSQVDTAHFRPRFNAGGTGVEVDDEGYPTSVDFTWTQNDNTVSWDYSGGSGGMVFTGTLSGDGNSMTGTAVSGSYTAGWRATN